jgi:hypothetical protein
MTWSLVVIAAGHGAHALLDALEPALDWLEQRLVLDREQANAPLPILADLIHRHPLLYRQV